MRLEITVVAGPGAIPFEPAELSIVLPEGMPSNCAGPDSSGPDSSGPDSSGPDSSGPDAPLSEGSPSEVGGSAVAEALQTRWPGAAFTVAGLPLGLLSVGRRPLTDGAVVVVDRAAGPAGGRLYKPEPPAPAPALLAVLSGPGAGALFPLHRGSYLLGRGRCGISIADPTLSRQHGTLTVGERAITLKSSPGSTGFSILRGWQSNPMAAAVPLKGTATVEVGDLIRCGMSGLMIHLSMPASPSRVPRAADDGGHGADVATAGSGHTSPDGGAVNGPKESDSVPWGSTDLSSLLDASVLTPVPLPASSAAPRNRWGALVAGLLPLVLGVLLAWLTGSLMFLAFAAMGAVAVLSPLLGGVRQRREFKASVAAAASLDAARSLAAFPGAEALLTAALNPGMHSGGVQDPERGSMQRLDRGPRPWSPPDRRIAFRVGTVNRRANLHPASTSPVARLPILNEMPTAVELGPSPIQISGASEPLRLLLHFVLMQLDAAGLPVVLLAPGTDLPLAARFLPHTALTGSRPAAAAALQRLAEELGCNVNTGPRPAPGPSAPAAPTAGPYCVLVSFNMQPSGLDAPYPFAASIVFSEQATDSGAGPPVVQLNLQGNCTLGRLDGVEFVPDGLPSGIFDRYARARAGHGGHRTAHGNPLAPSCIPLPELSSPQRIANRWDAAAGGQLRPVPVGHSAAGQEMFSFAEDGPHLLVGGTTGSGKSEFLRTLTASLALEHSPADVEFILVDFKGGAGLGTLQKFPHTSALITDLDGRGMDRILASLRTEIHRREALLAGAESANANTYRAGGADMAHLIIVVDEFRVLVDQYPDAMGELMRIAAVGRSLGIHLVMATQRPQGAISADIRANVTSSVCLRVQTTFDSQDVIGSGAAAFIGVDTPGRAFISRAGGQPTEFQSATVRLPATSAQPRPFAELAADCLRAGGTYGPVLQPAAVNGTVGPVGPAQCDGPKSLTPGPAQDGFPASGHEKLGPDMPNSDIDAVAELLTAAWRIFSTPRSRRNFASLGTDAAQSWNGVDAATVPDSAPRSPKAQLLTGKRSAAPAIVAPELPHAIDLNIYAASAHTSTVPGGRHLDLERGSTEDAVLLGLVDAPERQSLEPLFWSPSMHSHVAVVGTRAGSSAAVRLLATQLLVSNAGKAEASVQFVYLLDGDASLQALRQNPYVGSHVDPSKLRTAARLLRRLTEVADATNARMTVFATDWGRWVAGFRSSPWPWAEDCAAALVRNGSSNLAVVLGGERELLTAPFLAAVPNRVFLPLGTSSESRLAWPRLPHFAPLDGRAAIFGPINAAAAQGLPDEPHVAQLGLASSVGQNPFQGPGTQAAIPPLVVRELPTTLNLSDASQSLAGMTGKETPPTRSRTPGTTESAGRPTASAQPIVVGLGGDCATPVWLSVASGTFIPVLGGPGSGKSAFMLAVRELNGNPASILCVDDATLLPPERLQAISREVAAGSSALVAVPNHLPSLARLPLEWGLRTAEQGIIVTPRRPQDGELFGLRLDTAGSEPVGRAVLVDRGRTEWFQFPGPQQGTP